MADKTDHASFVCTGHWARSIVAERLLNHVGRGRFRARLAGSQPRGRMHPLTLAALERLKLPANGFRCKGWEGFATPGSPMPCGT